MKSQLMPSNSSSTLSSFVRFSPKKYVCLVIVLSVVLPRVLTLGSFPYMDEGYYTYYAQLIWHSLTHTVTLPDIGSLNLYSLLLAPFTALPGVPFFWVRLVDLGFAVCMAWLLCRILAKESENVILGSSIALICLLCMNVPEVINAGAKNSFFAASIPLFCALLVLERRTPTAYIVAGMLTAVGVLLREPFAVYSFAGVVLLWFGVGFRQACLYAMGGILAGVLILGGMCVWRGGWEELFFAYVRSGTVIGAESSRVWHNFFHYGWHFIADFWPFLIIVGYATSRLFASHDRKRKKRFLLWLTFLLAPFPELVGKICFTYHFSLLLPPLAGLCSLGLRNNADSQPRSKLFTQHAPFVAITISVLIFLLNFQEVQLSATKDLLLSIPTLQWSDEATSQSNTLLAAKEIRDANGETLSVSGFMHFLYPLVHMLPPRLGMDDLSRVFLLCGRDPQKMLALLKSNPPSIIAVGSTQEEDHVAMFTRELQNIVEASGLYVPLKDVPVDVDKNYGWIGCHIYARRQDNFLPLQDGSM